jgi:flagellar biosynthesis protein FlhF
MILKSYFTASIDAAMQQARLELGDEAMLLDARASSGEAEHLGKHEVIFALPDEAAATSCQKKNASSTCLPGLDAQLRPRDSDRLASDVVELRREIHHIRDVVARATSHPLPPVLQSSPELSYIYNRLLANDVAPEVAESIISASTRINGRDISSKSLSVNGLVRDQIAKTLRARPEYTPAQPKPSGAQRLMIFAGPSGSGKTSALVKLAVQRGLSSRKPVLILSFDNYRVASDEQLRAYASILGVAFQHVESVRAVHSVLEEHRHKHWVFVDTPGCGPKEAEVIQELSQLNKLNADLETHLVLSATMKSSDLKVAVRRFAPLDAGKLLFTHLDETEQHGGVLSAAAWSGKPVSYLSSGQCIPEDLEAATPERLLGLVLRDSGSNGPRSTRSDQAGTAAAGQ